VRRDPFGTYANAAATSAPVIRPPVWARQSMMGMAIVMAMLMPMSVTICRVSPPSRRTTT
jgi:hypothetical protein